MASSYNITSKLRIYADQADINKISKQIQTAVGSAKVQVNAKSLTTLNAQLRQTAAHADKLATSLQNVGTSTRYINASAAPISSLSKNVGNLNTASKQLHTTTKQTTAAIVSQGSAFELSARKMAVFLGSGELIRQFYFALRAGIRESITFQTELSKIGMIAEMSLRQQEELGQAIRKVGAAYGASSSQIAEATKLLASAGIQFTELKKTADILGKVNIAAGFADDGSLRSTSDTIILLNSLFRQSTAQEYARSLSAINDVANKFPAESSSILEGLKITGAAAVQSGMDLESLISVITTLRSKTRETNEVIGTSLRNSLLRLSRFRNINILRSLGIESIEGGKLRPAFEVLRELSQVVQTMGSGSPQLRNALEQIFGVRQVGRILPLLNDFNYALEVRNVALRDGAGLENAVAKRMETVGGQLQSLKENWLSFTDSLVDSGGLKDFLKAINSISTSITKLGRTIADFLPMLAALGSFKLGNVVGQRALAKYPLVGNVRAAQSARNTAMGQYVRLSEKAQRTGMPQIYANAAEAKQQAIFAQKQYDMAQKLYNAHQRVIQSSGVLATTFNKVRLGATKINTMFSMLGARANVTGLLAITSFGLSMAQQTPMIQAAFNTVTTGLIALSTGLNPAVAGLAALAMGVVSLNRALEQERRLKETKALEDVEQRANAQRAMANAMAPDVNAQLAQIDLQATLEKTGLLRQRMGQQNLEMGFGEFNRRTLGDLFTGNWGRLGSENKQIAARNEVIQAGLREDVQALKPELARQLTIRAQGLGSRQAVANDPVSNTLYQNLRAFDLLLGTVGDTEASFEKFLNSMEVVNERLSYASGPGTPTGFAGNISARSGGIRQMADFMSRNQDMLSIPITEFERSLASSVEDAFRQLPNILANTQFNNRDFASQVSEAMLSAGIDTAIVGSVEAALGDMEFESFAKSLDNVNGASEDLLKEYRQYRDAIGDLIESTKYAASVLEGRFTKALDTQANFLSESGKLATMFESFRTQTNMRTGTAAASNPFLSNAVAQQEAMAYSGTIDVQALSNALTMYTEWLNSHTLTLQDTVGVEDASTRVVRSLNSLANVSQRLYSIEKRKAELEGKISSKHNLTEAALTDPRGFARNMMMTVRGWFGGIQSLRPQDRGTMLSTLEQIGEHTPAFLGGMTGNAARQRVLDIEGEKLGLGTQQDRNELANLQQISNNIQQNALLAQQAIVQWTQQTAENTAKLVSGGVQPIRGGGLFAVPDKISLGAKHKTATGGARDSLGMASYITPQMAEARGIQMDADERWEKTKKDKEMADYIKNRGYKPRPGYYVDPNSPTFNPQGYYNPSYLHIIDDPTDLRPYRPDTSTQGLMKSSNEFLKKAPPPKPPKPYIPPSTQDSMPKSTININDFGLLDGLNKWHDKMAVLVNGFRTLSVSHNLTADIQVVHNGAQLFATLNDSMKTLVEKTIKKNIDDFIKSKIPNVGPMDWV